VATNGSEPTLDHLNPDTYLSELSKVYDQTGTGDEFAAERDAWLAVYEPLTASLTNMSFVLGSPFASGSTGVLFRVHDRKLGSWRALKIVRPRSNRLQKLLRLAEKERTRLNDLRHLNLVRVFFAGDVPIPNPGGSQPIRLPFFVMELLDPVEPLIDHVERTNDLASLRRVVRELGEAISYLHESNVAHLDLKPANVLILDGRPILVDLGYAKVMDETKQDLTGVMVTQRFAHPDLLALAKDESDPNAVIIEVPYSQIRPAFDMYSFGKSLFVLARAPGLRPLRERHDFEFRYLELIAARLVDGSNATDELVEGLTKAVFQEIKYANMKECLADIRRWSEGNSAASRIPELARNPADMLTLPPLDRVPFSARVTAVVEHPRVRRLRGVSQLGLLNLVYPGAVHSRLEHALGTFGITCRILSALCEDESNPVFRSIMRPRDLRATMVAALLHDLGQYPLAHDLEDASRVFSHVAITLNTLRGELEGDGSLGDVVLSNWQIDLQRVIDILSYAPSGSAGRFREGILARVVDGPIDADKLDYLRRDSAHLGLGYGASLDLDRLLACLTVAFGRKGNTFNSAVGIVEKGRATAEGVAMTRYQMFSTVYWHHASRALKVMIIYAGGRVIPVRPDQGEFERRLSEFVLGNVEDILSAPVSDRIRGLGDQVSSTDRSMLIWLAGQRRSDGALQEVIGCLLGRRLYKRLVPLVVTDPTKDGSEPLPVEWVSGLNERWVTASASAREEIRADIQAGVIDVLKREDSARYDEFMKLPETTREVGMLLDVPWKQREQAELPVIMEGTTRFAGLHASPVWNTLATDLNRSASIPRLFVHPDVHPILKGLPREPLSDLAKKRLGLATEGSFPI
jgi:serine/threonine protein kinase